MDRRLEGGAAAGRGLSAEEIDRFFRTWLARLPHPFSAADRRAGDRYDLSVLPAEFSLTQVGDRGPSGRSFFEEVVRENLEWGRPEQGPLIFGRKLQRKTVARGRCPPRGVPEGGTPSRHVDYPTTHLKQYHKEGRALRPETTINNPDDLGVGRRLKNRPALRAMGFAANRRVLEVERLSYDCQLGEQAFARLQRPAQVQGQHAAVLPLGQARGQALRGRAGELQPPTPGLSKPTSAAITCAEPGKGGIGHHRRPDEL